MASEPMASMDDLDDSEAMFGVVLGAARKYVAQKKKRKLAAMLMREVLERHQAPCHHPTRRSLDLL